MYLPNPYKNWQRAIEGIGTDVAGVIEASRKAEAEKERQKQDFNIIRSLLLPGNDKRNIDPGFSRSTSYGQQLEGFPQVPPEKFINSILGLSSEGRKSLNSILGVAKSLGSLQDRQRRIYKERQKILQQQEEARKQQEAINAYDPNMDEKAATEYFKQHGEYGQKAANAFNAIYKPRKPKVVKTVTVSEGDNDAIYTIYEDGTKKKIATVPRGEEQTFDARYKLAGKLAAEGRAKIHKIDRYWATKIDAEPDPAMQQVYKKAWQQEKKDNRDIYVQSLPPEMQAAIKSLDKLELPEAKNLLEEKYKEGKLVSDVPKEVIDKLIPGEMSIEQKRRLLEDQFYSVYLTALEFRGQ